MEELEKKLQQIKGGLVLDVGSGRGEFINLIKSFGSFDKIVANDVSARSGEFIKKQYPDLNLEFVEGNAKELNFSDDTFDTVCLSNSLHHLEETDKILKKMKKLLKPGGNFIINEMYCDDQNSAQISHVKLHHWFAKIDTIFGQKHDPTFTKKEIEEILKQLKLTNLDITDYHWPIADPKETEMIQERAKIVDAGLKRLEGHENFEVLKREGEEIRAYIMENGFAPASSLFIVGTK